MASSANSTDNDDTQKWNPNNDARGIKFSINIDRSKVNEQLKSTKWVSIRLVARYSWIYDLFEQERNVTSQYFIFQCY